MYKKGLLLLSLFLPSCNHDTEVRRLHIWPVYEDYIVSSATPQFIRNQPTEFGMIKYDLPKSWSYENAHFGQKVVTWVATTGSTEKLVITDSGFHPECVPLRESAVLSNLHHNEGPTVLVRFEGTNTAFTPDAVNFLPIDNLPENVRRELRALEDERKGHERQNGLRAASP